MGKPCGPIGLVWIPYSDPLCLARYLWMPIPFICNESLGFTTLYKDHASDTGLWLHCSFGLLLLNPFELDCLTVGLMGNSPVEMYQFCNNLLKYYITEDAMFSSHLSQTWKLTLVAHPFNRDSTTPFGERNPKIFEYLTERTIQ